MSAEVITTPTIHAPAGNRTRVCTVAGYYSTTRPLVLLLVIGLRNI
ncbi:hypothetical protein LINGRAHAP2_LOCUS21577 [Linum grandiflorum]